MFLTCLCCMCSGACRRFNSSLKAKSRWWTTWWNVVFHHWPDGLWMCCWTESKWSHSIHESCDSGAHLCGSVLHELHPFVVVFIHLLPESLLICYLLFIYLLCVCQPGCVLYENINEQTEPEQERCLQDITAPHAVWKSIHSPCVQCLCFYIICFWMCFLFCVAWVVNGIHKDIVEHNPEESQV